MQHFTTTMHAYFSKLPYAARVRLRNKCEALILSHPQPPAYLVQCQHILHSIT